MALTEQEKRDLIVRRRRALLNAKTRQVPNIEPEVTVDPSKDQSMSDLLQNASAAVGQKLKAALSGAADIVPFNEQMTALSATLRGAGSGNYSDFGKRYDENLAATLQEKSRLMAEEPLARAVGLTASAVPFGLAQAGAMAAKTLTPATAFIADTSSAMTNQFGQSRARGKDITDSLADAVAAGGLSAGIVGAAPAAVGAVKGTYQGAKALARKLRGATEELSPKTEAARSIARYLGADDEQAKRLSDTGWDEDIADVAVNRGVIKTGRESKLDLELNAQKSYNESVANLDSIYKQANMPVGRAEVQDSLLSQVDSMVGAPVTQNVRKSLDLSDSINDMKSKLDILNDGPIDEIADQEIKMLKDEIRASSRELSKIKESFDERSLKSINNTLEDTDVKVINSLVREATSLQPKKKSLGGIEPADLDLFDVWQKQRNQSEIAFKNKNVYEKTDLTTTAGRAAEAKRQAYHNVLDTKISSVSEDLYDAWKNENKNFRGLAAIKEMTKDQSFKRKITLADRVTVGSAAAAYGQPLVGGLLFGLRPLAQELTKRGAAMKAAAPERQPALPKGAFGPFRSAVAASGISEEDQ